MRRAFVFLPVLLVGQSFGAAPVAAVSSTQSITVSGVSVPTSRVISWPVSVNDEIITQSAPAMVRFADGTVVTLQRNSRMRLVPSQSGVEVKMLAGSAIYDLKPRSNVSIADIPHSNPVSTVRMPVSTAVTSVPLRGSSMSNAEVASALAHGSPAAGMTLASTSSIKIGAFHAAPKARTEITPNTDTVTLSNGTILEVNLVSGGGAGGQSTYIISKVEFAIQDPNGGVIYVTPPKGFESTLIGASFMVPGGLTPLVGVPLSVTLQNGTTLTPAQLAQLLQQAANAAYNDPNNFLPPGTNPPPPPGPVTSGNLSGHAT